MHKINKIYRRIIWVLLVICMICTGGCTRIFYRKQADCEVDRVLREKDVFPQWKIENMHVYPDLRARFADPACPDLPPMPPDDPAAKFLGPNPQKPRRAGVGYYEGDGYLDLLADWDARNRAERTARGRDHDSQSVVETIQRVAYLQKQKDIFDPLPAPRPVGDVPSVKAKPYLLRIDQAMEMGLINSREFQSRREDLYLTALPVTRERFAFSAQFLALEQVLRERTGANAGAGEGDRWSYASTAGVSKLFSTGALLLVGFANQTVVNFANPTASGLTSVTSLNLDFIQPLLRGGGKAVSLEPLTLAERNLLYEIRNYSRFRKQYYQYMIGGADLSAPLPGAVTSAGSLASGRPLLGTLSGSNAARQQVVPAGLGAVGGAATPGTLFLGINPLATSEGFLPSLYKAAVVRYEVDNVKALSDVLKLFEAYESGGQVSSLQVGQVKLQLLQGQSSVINNEQTLQTSLDTFKTQLGVPLNVPIELDDQPIRPVTDHLQRFDQIIQDYQDATLTLDELYQKTDPGKVRAALLDRVRTSTLTKLAPKFLASFPNRWEKWRLEYKDAAAIFKRMTELREQERKLQDLKTDLEKQDKSLSPADQAKLHDLDVDIATGILEQAMRRYETAPWLKLPNEAEKLKEKSARWRDLRNAFVLAIGDAGKERFDHLRPTWPALPPVVFTGVDLVRTDREESYKLVTQAALENRLDMMNARAQLVDAWRQVRVFANGLLGTFNLQYHGDTSTPAGANMPLAFQAANTRHQMVMNFELPLVRMAERNAYRASLIAYQRSRRDLMQKEDEIVGQVRSDIRQLQVLAKNFIIQQQALELAYQQVESSLETFRAPQVPDNSPNAAANASASAAALTNQLLQAYGRLPQAKEQVLKTWVDYQIARQQLYLDIELMPIDARGVWIDEYADVAPDRKIGQLERGADGFVRNDPRNARRARASASARP